MRSKPYMEPSSEGRKQFSPSHNLNESSIIFNKTDSTLIMYENSATCLVKLTETDNEEKKQYK